MPSPAVFNGASLIGQLVKNPPAMQETWFNSLVGEIRERRDKLPTPVFTGFLCGSSDIENLKQILADAGSHIVVQWTKIMEIGGFNATHHDVIQQSSPLKSQRALQVVISLWDNSKTVVFFLIGRSRNTHIYIHKKQSKKGSK